MNVRDAIPIVDDWKLLMSRTYSSLDSSANESFNRKIHLFATNEDVDNHNRRSLASLNHSIAQNVVVALLRKYYCYEDDEKMQIELLLSIGARVMLTSNLWTNAVLINGALGFIERIVYNPGCSHMIDTRR